jgi:prepilin-type N-terminal cleavage/methylation domain-containing protein
MKNIPSKAAFTLIELLVVISIIAILAGIALPVFTQVQEKGQQTKVLSNAKQVGLALKLYAGDNDGKFPTQPVGSTGTGGAIADANEAFRNLVPQYVPSEKIFYVAKSAFTPNPPDENTSANNALVAGENHFAYVTNLTDTSNPNFPLVADGFATANTGTYTNVETSPGGVWKGKKAIVVRADMSGAVENCDTNFQVLGNTGGSTKANIFVPASGWLSPTQVPVNPL